MASTTEPLDLYDIALLISYEYTLAKPEFRGARLIDVTSRDKLFPMLPGWNEGIPEWRVIPGQSREAYLFDKTIPNTSSEPDSPSNLLWEKMFPGDNIPFLRNGQPAAVSLLSPRELETIFYTSRNFNACGQTTGVLWRVLDMYSKDQRIRIRTTTGKMFTTTVDRRFFQRLILHRPKKLTVIVAKVHDSATEESVWFTGAKASMNHMTIGFFAEHENKVSVVLDLSSMQFGELGRGLKSNGMFALESTTQYHERLKTLAGNVEHIADYRYTTEQGKATPEWAKDVSRRVKERWDRRDTDPWCGHCGAPSTVGKPLKKCMRCLKVWYCDAQHQKVNWQFHKQYCSGQLEVMIAQEAAARDESKIIHYHHLVVE
ncbi:hypothetical protein BT63DRAFT_465516 [Microthyrium microscopicum]|uniref:MYND-type domain-containing protein n=1 Tax=Microthyrium microscopicum TaxID=703497 RepID=A0A6A6TYY6_9PEZI|nr:hypothetical protein BT63DRAFT_465516 [Microthyrium microscopicum]